MSFRAVGYKIRVVQAQQVLGYLGQDVRTGLEGSVRFYRCVYCTDYYNGALCVPSRIYWYWSGQELLWSKKFTSCIINDPQKDNENIEVKNHFGVAFLVHTIKKYIY